MVDGIDGPGTSRPYASRQSEAHWVRVRHRQDRKRDETSDKDADSGFELDPDSGLGSLLDVPAVPRATAARAAQAYGRAPGGEPADVVMSRSAAILADLDLNSALNRAGAAIEQLALTFLGISPDRTSELVHHFKDVAIDWVRQALARYRNFADHHDNLPIGITFDDVRIEVDPEEGGIDLEVGGVHFRSSFDFRAVGVVFDVRGTSAVEAPSPGFFVDTGDRGADTADEIIDRVRSDLPSFGAQGASRGVSVLIRADNSDYTGDAGGASVVDMDVLVPFSADWSGAAPASEEG